MNVSRLTSLLLGVVAAGVCATATNSTGPVVDLPYALYAPKSVVSPDLRTYYNFSNIRYAAPPTRFQLPQDPPNNRSVGVQDGSYGKICPQAYTPWQSSAAVTAPPGELESEDCLFLDVVVSADAWSQRTNAALPVIVWFHGGGYQIGAKWGGPMSNPLGLLDRSYDGGNEGVIWVGFNYRVSLSVVACNDDTFKGLTWFPARSVRLASRRHLRIERRRSQCRTV